MFIVNHKFNCVKLTLKSEIALRKANFTGFSKTEVLPGLF